MSTLALSFANNPDDRLDFRHSNWFKLNTTIDESQLAKNKSAQDCRYIFIRWDKGDEYEITDYMRVLNRSQYYRLMVNNQQHKLITNGYPCNNKLRLRSILSEKKINIPLDSHQLLSLY